jgi:ribosomal-protein-alanine N-acetyltransferase
VLEWGFGELGLTRIVGVAYPDNTASQRVLQKVGMRRLGLRHCYGAELVEYVAERPAGVTPREAPAPTG